MIWASVALAMQLRAAYGGGRRDYSQPLGRPRQGVGYFLTAAMLPAHKESVRHHPLESGIGVIMHLGTLLALLGITALVLHPAAGVRLLSLLSPLLLLSLAAGISLFVRRLVSPNLRYMSAPDDYVAILATCGLLAASASVAAHPRMPFWVLLYGAVLLVYLPLGKLRHALFFFAARIEYGRRLGHRGVYPPPPREAASHHG